MQDAAKGFLSFRDNVVPSWPAEYLVGDYYTLRRNKPFSVRLERPKLPKAIPPYESCDGPSIAAGIEILARQVWKVEIVTEKEYDKTLERVTSTLIAITLHYTSK